MKVLRLLLLVLICVAMATSMLSCTTDGEQVPDGMKLATAVGDDFRLYVPTVWNENLAYGTSGAYYNMSVQSTVSVVKYTLGQFMETALAGASGSARLDLYYEMECIPAVEQVALTGSVVCLDTETESVLLDTLNARRYHAKATVEGKTVHFVHVLAEKGGAVYVFTLTVDDSLYEEILADVNAMLENFIFADPYETDDYVKGSAKDPSAPDGMILASNDDVAYRFYVPTGWQINRDEAIFAAYLEQDRTNVSVVPYMPEVESMSVGEFFGMCRDAMLATAGEDGFELLSQETVDLGGRQATAYIYTYSVGGVTYYYKQVVAAYKSMIYSMTYTAATSDAYQAHLAELDAMIEAFEFR